MKFFKGGEVAALLVMVAEIKENRRAFIVEWAKKIYTLLIILILIIIASNCGEYIIKKMEKHDTVARAVHKQVGRKVSYWRKAISTDGIRQYMYSILDEEEKTLVDMAETVDEVLKEKDIREKVVLVIMEEWDGRDLLIPVINLSNYNEVVVGVSDDSDDYQSQSLNYLIIYGNEGSKNSLYNQASTYINLKNIKYLRVVDVVNQNAKEEGIDWYEIWPDLEGYEVFKQDSHSHEYFILYQESKADHT